MNHYSRYVLMLEDDGDDRYITSTFFAENRRGFNVAFINSSDGVLPFLEDRAAASDPLLCMIMLDKNAPPTSGVDVLRDLKAHQSFRCIPVVMLSGSAQPSEVMQCYALGCSSFIIKPSSHADTASKIRNFLNYWFATVELPEVVGGYSGIDGKNLF